MKVWLEELGVAKSRGFRAKERNAILASSRSIGRDAGGMA